MGFLYIILYVNLFLKTRSCKDNFIVLPRVAIIQIRSLLHLNVVCCTVVVNHQLTEARSKALTWE